MNRLLVRDKEIFESQFSGAVTFLEAAHLRYEAFTLLHFEVLNKWETGRLAELLKTPACNTQDFDTIKQRFCAESLDNLLE